MTLRDAVETGRPFRITGHKYWLTIRGGQFLEKEEFYSLKASDVLSDEWEIKEEMVEVTLPQLKVAFWQAFNADKGGAFHIPTALSSLAKNLGFTEDPFR